MFPGETAQESGALIFFVGREGCKVDDEKIRKRERGQRDDNDNQQAMIFFGLKKEANGWDDIRNMRSESRFTEATVEQADGRNGVGEDEQKRKK